MDKASFYLESMLAGRYKELAWIIRAFSLVRSKPGEVYPDGYPYVDGNVWKISRRDREHDVIEGASVEEPLLNRKEKLLVKAGQIPGFLEDMTVSMGRILFHCIVCVYPFGDKIPFRDKRLNPRKDIEPIIAELLTDTPEDPDAERDPKLIYTDELIKYSEAVGGLLAGTSQIFTPAATRKSLTTDPEVYKLRDALYAEAEKNGRANDPAEIAKIKAALGKVDRAWLADDPAKDYLIKDKSYNQVRMKTLLTHGEENGFGDGNQVVVIKTGLNEGWNLDNLPDYANSLREGSFNRGYQTMLGGEATQFLTRVFQNYAITLKDCESVLGVSRVIPVERAKDFVGSYVLEGGKIVNLSPENISVYADKRVTMRSPMYCHTGGSGTGYCSICMGDRNAKFPNALGTQASDIGSTMMYIFMKKAHATELKTVAFDPSRDFH